MYRTLLLLMLVMVGISSCRNAAAPEDTDPTRITLQNLMKREASKGNLYSQAVVASGLIDDLGEKDFPFTLIDFYEEKALEAYIAKQGLTEAEFLAHPKLRDFLKQHLIPGYVDLIKIRSTPNGRFTYTSAAGSEVVFTTGKDLTQTPDSLNVAKANGIPFSPYCGYEGAEGGQLCYATAPIVQSFDWSQ